MLNEGFGLPNLAKKFASVGLSEDEGSHMLLGLGEVIWSFCTLSIANGHETRMNLIDLNLCGSMLVICWDLISNKGNILNMIPKIIRVRQQIISSKNITKSRLTLKNNFFVAGQHHNKSNRHNNPIEYEQDTF